MPFQSDKAIKTKRPDKGVKDKKRRTFLRINICLLPPKETPSSLKLQKNSPNIKKLEIETERMWNMNTTIVAIVKDVLSQERKRCLT